MRRAVQVPLAGILLLGCMSSFGCAPEAEPEPDMGSSEAPAAADEATEGEAVTRARPFLPVSMQRSTRAETFPHETHVEISCAVCHEAVDGHTSHGALECADCHRSSVLAVQEEVTPEQCLTCHHGPLQEAQCIDCHASVGSLTPSVPVRFDVWEAVRNRVLPFEHVTHTLRNCDVCHNETPSLAPEPGCVSCHDDHHEAEARCITCHEPPTEQAHDVDSHLTCGGSGCHTDPVVEAIAGARATCLVCHQEYEDHEPEQECAECHQVRPGGGGAW